MCCTLKCARTLHGMWWCATERHVGRASCVCVCVCVCVCLCVCERLRLPSSFRCASSRSLVVVTPPAADCRTLRLLRLLPRMLSTHMVGVTCARHSTQ